MQEEYAVESDSRMMSVPNKKKQKISFLKRWLLKSVKEAVDQERQNQPNQIIRDDIIGAKQARGLQIGPPNIDQPDRALQFTVYTANGGRIVETRKYDRKTDRNSNGLYIITNEQDFGREIDKIITMEALK